jgi:nickel/cobalt transporter (NicO) family protein
MLSVLLLGVGLGLRHATDADHVVVVSNLVQREAGLWKAARIAALWGLGHGAAFFVVGAAIVVGGVSLPAAFEPITDGLVALMLIGMGIVHLLPRREERERTAPDYPSTGSMRPVLVGVVHGLAGSASVALLAMSTIPSRGAATLYLLFFGAGTVLGMVALTALLARPLAYVMQSRVRRIVTIASALTSLGLGVWLGVALLL